MKLLCQDLSEEHAALDEILNGLDESQWDMKTPFYDWTIKFEICHLAYFDDKANLAATDPEAFQADMMSSFEGITSVDDWLEKTTSDLMKMAPKDLMDFWIKERTRMISTFEALDPEDKIPWYGPPMTAASFVIARIMETWAHGQDVVDALTAWRKASDRLKHIAHLGVKTFGWSYVNRGLEKPDKKVRVELKSPSGETWLWNEEAAENVISGSAEDFCLVVAQRRHVDDTGLVTSGSTAREWMTIAQVFAGPPENGPEAGRLK